ncbi:MAG: DUF5666 domain-containing protein [Myxococcota bacterium]|nr:hypothetical protein [Myxococcales bacterium]
MTMREAHARRSRCVRGICGRSRRLVGLGRRLGVVLLLAALACVEGTQTADNGGMSGTGISQGAIDSFGSIFVNGVEWRTGSASVEIDDAAGGEGDLRVGMVVRVRGTLDADGLGGRATSVVFDAELKGPVEADPVLVSPAGVEKRFEVLGRSVVVHATGTAFGPGTGFDAIARDDVVSISGFVDGAGELRATRVEQVGVFPAVTAVELEGTVASLARGANGSGLFDLGPITVEYTAATTFADGTESALANGDRVEVRGALVGGGTTRIAASRIEREASGLGIEDAEDAELEGIVTGYVSDADFRVGGVPVDASGATRTPGTAVIADGSRVEVKGPLVAGTLRAERVEIEDAFQDDVRIEAAIGAIDAAARTIRLLGVDVRIEPETALEDERDHVPNFGFAHLAVGDRVEVEARTGAAPGAVVAAKVERERARATVVLEGPVSALDRLAPALSVLGVAIPLDGATQYFGADGSPVDEATFFADPGGVLETDRVRVVDDAALEPDALLEADRVLLVVGDDEDDDD